MFVSLSVLLFLFQFLPFSTTEIAFGGFHHSHCDNVHGNYTTTDQQNLETLHSDISSTTKITNNFYHFSSDLVNGVGYCRGEVKFDGCRNCLANAATKFMRDCPIQKKATGYYDICVLRYSDQPINGVLETSPTYQRIEPHQPVNQSNFDEVLSGLLASLVNNTIVGSSTLKYTKNIANLANSSLHIYAFTQCSPDLSSADCHTCLSDSISDLPTCCQGYQSVRYFRPTCTVRFVVRDKHNTPVFSPPPLSSPPSTPPPSTNANSPEAPFSPPGRGRRTLKIVAIVVSIIIVCSLLGIVMYVCLRTQGKMEKEKVDSELEEVGEDEDEVTRYKSLRIAYQDVKDATNDFSNANMLGKGGFGTVYKGKLENGQEIAVKRLASNSSQGEEEFRNEVLLVAKLQHRNLVRLLGYSFAGEERLLIYEFMPNASLDHFLFGKARHNFLEWNSRYKIIKGIARGLLYLHEDSRLRIIHRDLKAANVLLDGHLNPKIADFGMARLFQADQTHADTERIAGTIGYMPPEYVYRGIYSVKSDIYSFGVLLLEIVTGQKNSNILESDSMDDLLTSVWMKWSEGRACEVVDTTLVSVSRGQVTRCIQLGLLCVQAAPINRPTMSLINLMLNSESHTIPVPSQPAYVLKKSMVGDSHSLSATEEESITELYPR